MLIVAAQAAHSGVVPARTGFALSDLATFVVVAALVLLARRGLRRRRRKD